MRLELQNICHYSEPREQDFNENNQAPFSAPHLAVRKTTVRHMTNVGIKHFVLDYCSIKQPSEQSIFSLFFLCHIPSVLTLTSDGLTLSLN